MRVLSPRIFDSFRTSNLEGRYFSAMSLALYHVGGGADANF
jgi:hypothetical protein